MKSICLFIFYALLFFIFPLVNISTVECAPTPVSFTNVVHAETNSWYWQNIPNGEGKDHWFWGKEFNANQSRAYSIATNSVYQTNANCIVRIRFQGRGTAVHKAALTFNGVPIPDAEWVPETDYTYEAVISQDALLGKNTLGVKNKGNNRSLYLDWIEIEYEASFKANNNYIEFPNKENGVYLYEIDGFTTDALEIFAVNNNTDRIIDYTITTSENGFKVAFERKESFSQSKYIILSSENIKSTGNITKDQPSNLKSKGNGADYIIITHKKFYDSLIPLKAYRENKGLRVKMVKVEDVYDEFNNGIKNPQAIKDFLRYTNLSWEKPAPTYVLLVGNANLDYKNEQGSGVTDYMPTHLFETLKLGQTPTDNWFVSFSGDYIPDMAIGRISVRTEIEANAVVEKIIKYENNETAIEKTLFIADDDVESFANMSDELADIVTSDYSKEKIYLKNYPGSPKQGIIEQMNNGTLITTYIGHGNVTFWAKEKAFTSSSISSLSNGDNLSFVVVLNCLNGFFPLSGGPLSGGIVDSMAESFLNAPDKGAIACLAPTSVGAVNEHRILGGALFKSIFEDGIDVVGSAVLAAKYSSSMMFSLSRNITETFTLFGDPALKLRTNKTAIEKKKAAYSENFTILHSDANEFIVEFVQPEFSVKEMEYSGDVYQVVTAPGFTNPLDAGKLQLPEEIFLVGVPEEKDVEIEIIDVDYNTAPDLLLHSNTTDEEAVYGSDILAKIEYSGMIRNQRITRLSIYPVQYNPVTKEARLYTKIKVRLKFIEHKGKVNSTLNVPESEEYEKILRAILINYDGLDRKRSYFASEKIFKFAEPPAPTVPVYKIKINREGIYSLAFSELEAAGMFLSEVDPRTVKMINRNFEIPIHISGEADGTADPEDYVEFYGEPAKSIFTDDNVYWLTYGGENGKRMAISVQEENTPPDASFTVAPALGSISTTFNFDASGSTDVQDQANDLEVRWDWENDGVWDTEFSTTKTASHLYSEVGNYTVKLEVKDNLALTDTATKGISVMPVNVTHEPILSATVGKDILVEIMFADSVGTVTLNYRTVGSEEFDSVEMIKNEETNTWHANIPGNVVTTAGIEYSFSYNDGLINISSSSYQVEINEGVPTMDYFGFIILGLVILGIAANREFVS